MTCGILCIHPRIFFKALDDEEENIFLNLYKKHLLSSILESSPNVVGISITNTSQIIPGLTLARLIKNQNKEIHITVGGSVFTKLIENIKRWMDCFQSWIALLYLRESMPCWNW